MTSLILSIASLVVAVVAVVISLSQVRLTKRDSQRAKPNIALKSLFTDNLAHGGERARAVCVTLNNTGREDTEVASIWIYSGRTMLNGTHNRLGVDEAGPTLPCRIGGHSQLYWTIDASNIEAEASEVTVVIELGHGETVSQQVKKQ
ncbi:hypothetical protein [Streptomyces microflavus]|uniref:hypothetical protein n=1 Tax=Streptomyces microflavus TaxID=1919 RepID=UPI0033A31034